MASYMQEETCQSADIRSICSAHALAHVFRLGLAAQQLAPCCCADWSTARDLLGHRCLGWEDQPFQWLSIHTGMKQRERRK